MHEVQKGDPVDHTLFNEIVRAVSDRQSTFVPKKVVVVNDSGAAVSRGGILGVDGPASGYAPSDSLSCFCNADEIMLSGVEPTVADHMGKWVVPLDSVAAGQPCECAGQIARVRVYVNATTDKFCDVIAAETVSGETCYLGTGASGAQILWLDPDATAETIGWAIVRLGGSPREAYAFATTTDAVTAELSSFTVTDIEPHDGSDWDGDDPLTVTVPVAGWIIDAAAKGVIKSYVDHDTKLVRWMPIDFPCPAEEI